MTTGFWRGNHPGGGSLPGLSYPDSLAAEGQRERRADATTAPRRPRGAPHRAAESLRADFERREPRCRICPDESVRVLVNTLLDWHGAPIILGRGKTHVVTYADILRDLEPLNKGRDKKNRITYDSLRVHAKRHYDIEGIAAYWTARFPRELRKALGRKRAAEPIEQSQGSR
jgi:hypothetical protein